MSFKVLYHAGDTMPLKTKGNVGRLSLNNLKLTINGNPVISVPFESLHSVELFRLHGIGRMLKIEHEAGTLFVTVIRFCLFGFFAMVNFFATGRLKRELEAAIQVGNKIRSSSL